MDKETDSIIFFSINGMNIITVTQCFSSTINERLNEYLHNKLTTHTKYAAERTQLALK